MANIIYKGALDGTQVNFETGNLTDISTFTGDVRAAAIEDSIANGVTDRGASQDAIHAMSGYLAANAHPSVTPASDIAIDNSSGTVLQDATFTFDSDGHVTAASFDSINLDTIYSTIEDVNSISGDLQSQITSNDTELGVLRTATGNLNGRINTNDTELGTLRTATGTLSTATGNLDGRINSNDGELTVLRAATGVLRADVDSNDTELGVLRTATGNLNDRIDTNDTELGTLRTATGYLENEIDSLQAVSGSFLSLTLDDVCDNGAITDKTITAVGLRVTGDGTSASITGPSTITIDPDSSGPAGTVVIQGDLQVEGTTTTISSTDVQIGDINMILGTGAANDAAADGGGIIISGTDASTIAEFTYDSTNDRWKTNSLDIEADIVGNASTATAWTADSTITLGGDLSGAVTFNAGSSETLTATIGANVVENTMLENASVAITGGAGLAGGGNAVLGGSAVSLSIAAGDGLTAGTDALDINLDGTTLSKGASGLKVNSVTSAELDSSVAGENITFNGGNLQVLDADITAGVQSDLGHLNEIKLGEDSTTLTDIIVKGGILILRGLSTNGITTSGSDGDVLAIDQKTTVSYDGIVQIMNRNEDTDDGSWNGLWKVQGIIRRDSGTTISKVSCFTTKIHAGSNLSAYSISTTTSSTGFVISPYNAGNSIPNNIVTTATLNYNWSQEA